MELTLPLLLKGLLAGVIVGLVTASIKSWVDRFFLVILLVSLVSLPIQEAVVVNLVVIGLAALMLALRQWQVLTSVREEWPRIVLPSILGGALGRLLALQTHASIFIIVLGILRDPRWAAPGLDQTHARARGKKPSELVGPDRLPGLKFSRLPFGRWKAF